MSDITENILIESLKCVKCGSCLSVCPVYKELCEESSSPRGRAALSEEIGKENIELTPKLVEIFTKCLGCGACEEVCVKGVPVTKLVYEMRELLYNKRRYDTTIRSILKLMYTSPYIFSLLLKKAALLKPILFEEITDEDILKPRLKLPFIDASRMLPKVRKKFFLENDFDEINTKKAHVSLYVGCIFNFIYPDVGTSSLNILSKLETNVHVTTKQICCGSPALSVGDFHSLKELILKNIDILDETDPKKIIVPCSSCSLMFKKYYPMVFDESEESLKIKVLKFAEKVVDFSMYLQEHKDKLEKIYDIKSAEDFTYHMPCHLSKGLHADNVFQKIFSDKENLTIVDPDNPDSCCGYGGVFNFKYHELSQKISDRKVTDILKTKPKTLLTTCSGCMMQLKEGLIRHNSEKKVMHIAEFINKFLT